MPCVDGQAKIGEPVEVDGWLIEIVNFAHESPGHCTESFNGERYAAVLFTRPWSGSSLIEKTHPPAHDLSGPTTSGPRTGPSGYARTIPLGPRHGTPHPASPASPASL